MTTPHPHPATPPPEGARTTLETALENLPVGCTLIVYRTDSPPGYRLQVRDDTPLRSYEAGYVRESSQVGEAAMGGIEHQRSYEAMAARDWEHNRDIHVTVSQETKQRLMAEYGLTEADFDSVPPATGKLPREQEA